MTPDGELDFIGRIDHQVKLNGFRIELDEIAAVLREHPAVQDVAVVVGRVGDEDRLIGYAVAPSAEPLELREFAAGRLPHFMVPSVALIDRLPLLPNGKLDRAALPALDRASLGLGDGGAEAGTETERRLADITAEFLGIDGVGVDDDFFLLGGALAARRAPRGAGPFGVRHRAADIEHLRAAHGGPDGRGAGPAGPQRADAPPVVRVPRDRPLPLSFPQERIWFLEQLSPATSPTTPRPPSGCAARSTRRR